MPPTYRKIGDHSESIQIDFDPEHISYRQLADEYISIYPEPGLFTDSTATARVNGYLGGNGTLLQLESELALLGLSPVGQTHLREQFDYLSN